MMKSESLIKDNFNYLSLGNDRQKEAYAILIETNIFSILAEFTPVLVGTIPIDVDIPGSDLDIICEVHDWNKFEEVLIKYFSMMDHYRIFLKTVSGLQSVICNFEYKGWIVEVFGQPIPVRMQNGYKHMIIESRILEILGEESRDKIRELKKSGFKTEPAFGELLRLDGNPYEILSDMYDWDEQRLKAFLKVLH